jgi:hypothetical protein
LGKRSDFARRPMDAYQTIDPRAVPPLLPHLHGIRSFAEPCAGDGYLVEHLTKAGLFCKYASDITEGANALEANDFGVIDAIITNPPWTREILHPMILHFQKIAPTWLLFDADWAHTRQCSPFMRQCSHIVSVGRLIWMPGTKMTGKDNCAWYRFDARHNEGPRFIEPLARAA